MRCGKRFTLPSTWASGSWFLGVAPPASRPAGARRRSASARPGDRPLGHHGGCAADRVARRALRRGLSRQHVGPCVRPPRSRSVIGTPYVVAPSGVSSSPPRARPTVEANYVYTGPECETTGCSFRAQGKGAVVAVLDDPAGHRGRGCAWCRAQAPRCACQCVCRARPAQSADGALEVPGLVTSSRTNGLGRWRRGRLARHAQSARCAVRESTRCA